MRPRGLLCFVAAALAATAAGSRSWVPQPKPGPNSLGLGREASCPVCGEPVKVGSMQMEENSGIAESMSRPGVYYAVDDSPQGPFVYAIEKSGAVVQRIKLFGLESVQSPTGNPLGDWEDVAVGPCCPGCRKSCVFVADIGAQCVRDGCENHRRVQNIIRFEEPTGREMDVVVHAERLWWRYSKDFGEHDAESLIVTPAGEFFVVTKEDGFSSTVFKLPNLRPGFTVLAEPVVRLDNLRSALFTSAGLQLAGGGVAGVTLRTHSQVLHFPVGPGESMAEALAKQPCVLTSPVQRKSEGLTWDRQRGSSYLVTSGGAGSDIMQVTCAPPGASDRPFLASQTYAPPAPWTPADARSSATPQSVVLAFLALAGHFWFACD